LCAFTSLRDYLAGRDCELEKTSLWLASDSIDFDNPTRADVEILMAVLEGGKWKKEPSGIGGRLDYKTEKPVVGELKLRLWAAHPPETCRLVEEKYVVPAVPAQPERTETRMVLKCEPEPASTIPAVVAAEEAVAAV
jgi:hypothetical protein